ncbi:MAG: discoidin domain-containing protein [Muribaculaceae bacterium]|nr:discoidin domain-containing protein [Muribaculaceae bacterium]
MKQFNILSLVMVVLMFMLPCTVKALPFVPTTNPNLSTNYWYFIKTNDKYIGGSSNYEITFSTTANVNNEMQLWCFVGTENDGYRVYNKGLGKYIVEDTFFPTEDPNSRYTYYEAIDESTFYLRFYIPNQWHYLYQETYSDQYGFMDYMAADPNNRGVFSAIEAIKGSDQPEELSWTRYDTDGVGYRFVEGGTSSNTAEIASNLCDGNASTKYLGTPGSYWVTIEASTDVAVKQYSLVTANDSRRCYDRTIRSWKLQGSNDNVNWTDIDQRSDYPMPFADQQEVVFTVNDTHKYRYFKLVTLAGTGSLLQLSELWINGQTHIWDSPTITNSTCGTQGTNWSECTDCHARRMDLLPPTGEHNYVNGVCAVCGLEEGVTVLLHNGQSLPYNAKSQHFNTTEYSLEEIWLQVDYDDSSWMDLTLPIASPGHSNGPFNGLMYNSNWYGEYNLYFIRRPFNISVVDPNATYYFHCIHDDNMKVFVNGHEAINQNGWTETPDGCNWENSYETFELPASLFQSGDNILVVWIEQNWGGAYFDCELIMKQGNNNPITGDVNGDGLVDVEDVNAVINIILKVKSTSDYPGNADLSGDNIVDVIDVNSIINIILKK